MVFDKGKISVIVPIYNAEKYLERCLSSIVAQTYINLQVILVNDGSTDSSLEICRRWEKIDKRVLVINSDNKGVANARNKGLAKAVGEYIGFVDADDEIEIDMYQALLQNLYLQKADIVCCTRKYFNETGHLLRETHNKETNLVEEEMLCAFFHFSFDGSACTKLFRHAIIHEKKIQFDVDIYNNEDYLFVGKYLNVVHRCVLIDKSYYHYYLNSNSSCDKKNWQDCFEKKRMSSILAADRLGGLIKFQSQIMKESYECFLLSRICDTIVDMAVVDYSQKQRRKQLQSRIQRNLILAMSSNVFTWKYKIIILLSVYAYPILRILMKGKKDRK